MKIKGLSLVLFIISFNLFAGEKMRSEKLHNYYTKLSLENMEILRAFYTEDVRFIDPVGELKGVDAVYDYTKKMYQGATSVKFDILEEAISADTHVIRWKMDFKSKQLNGGESIIVPGISWIRFKKDSDKVEFHEDSFDIGAMVYEHVPVVGFLVRSIKNKFKHKEVK